MQVMVYAVESTFIRDKIAMKKGEGYNFSMTFTNTAAAESWMTGVNNNEQAPYYVDAINFIKFKEI